MPFVSDTFTDASTTNLTAHTGETGATWVKGGGQTGDIKISTTNDAFSDTAAVALYVASGTPASAEYDVEVTYKVKTSAQIAGVIGRKDPTLATYTCYMVYYSASAGKVQLFKLVAGVATGLGTDYTVALADGDVLKLQIRDAAKKVFLNGVERITSADNSITTAGFAGIVTAGAVADLTGIHFNSFTASDNTTDLVYHGVTITFQGALVDGTDYVQNYLDGSYWIKPGTIALSRTPAASGSGSTLRNGTAINFNLGAAGADQTNPFDGRHSRYNVSKAMSFPHTFANGESMLCALSMGTAEVVTDQDGQVVGTDATALEVAHPGAGSSYTTFIKDWSVWTCMTTKPAASSFRPGCWGTTKKEKTTSDISGTLPSLAKTTNAVVLATYQSKSLGPWVNVCQNGSDARNMHAGNYQSNYGHEWALNVARQATLLCYSDNGSRTTLRNNIIQQGIDIHSAYNAGMIGYGDGGLNQGWLFPICFAGFMLNDADLQDMTDFIYSTSYKGFQEIDQTFYVDSTEVGFGIGYVTADIGLADWGIEHAAWYISQTGHADSPSLSSSYRVANSENYLGICIAMQKMGIKNYVGHQPLFDYAYRWGALGGNATDLQEFFDTYKAVVTVSGPSTGAPLVQSTAYTYTISGSDEVDDSVIVTSSNASDHFYEWNSGALGDEDGVGSLALDAEDGTTIQFVVVWASVGTRTLTFTNNFGANPRPWTVVVAVAASGGQRMSLGLGLGL